MTISTFEHPSKCRLHHSTKWNMILENKQDFDKVQDTRIIPSIGFKMKNVKLKIIKDGKY